MDKFKTTVITNAGRKMINDSIGSNGKINYTKAGLYDQDLTGLSDDNLKGLTQLSDKVLETDARVVDITQETVTIEASFTNKTLYSDAEFRCIGWYAKLGTGDETLIAVTPSANSQILSAGANGKATSSIDVKLVMKLDQTSQIELNPIASGQIDNSALNSALANLKVELTANLADKNNVYDKDTVDSMIKNAGQVKSVTLNSHNYLPDKSTGEVNIGDALLPDLTTVFLNNADVPFKYTSSVNKYRADIDSLLRAEISSMIDGINIRYSNEFINSSGQLSRTNWITHKTSDGYFSINTQDADQTAKYALDGYTKATTLYPLSPDRYQTITDLDNPPKQTGAYIYEAGNQIPEASFIPNSVGGYTTVYVIFHSEWGTAMAITADGYMAWNGYSGGKWNGWHNSADNKQIDTVGNFTITGDTGYGTRQNMIKFKQGTDQYGMGIAIGGGGTTVVGGGESAQTYLDGAQSAGDDRLVLANDAGIDIYTNFQAGLEYAHHETIDNNGVYSGTSANAQKVNNHTVDDNVPSYLNSKLNQININGNMARTINASNTWTDILGISNAPNSVLKSIRDESQSGHLMGNYASAIAFGGADTKGVLNVAYSDHKARIIGGNGSNPVWHEDIAWKSDLTQLENSIKAWATSMFALLPYVTSDRTDAENHSNANKGQLVILLNK